GDVLQRRALAASLGERARRLALEVDDDEVLAGIEDLPEVEVAMAADAAGGDLALQERVKDLQHARLEHDGAPHALGKRLGKRLEALARQLEDARLEIAQRLIHRALHQRGERFGFEIRIVAARRQRQVELGGAPAEQARRLELRAEQLARQRGRLAMRQLQDALRGQLDAMRAGDRLVEEALDLVNGERPGVAVVRDIALDDAHRSRLALLLAVLQRARHLGDVGEVGMLGEKAPDLELGIDAILQAAEQL